MRETKNLVRRFQAPPSNNTPMPLDPDIRRLQEKLSRQLNLRVAIHCSAKGKGKLVIHYRNLGELNELLSQIQSE